ncbi:MAG: hypothetical protein JNK82_24595 [Myxococcaceae bacterium]|nr:hypothetical protein [Myxococcaceae bacterium]
MRTLLWLGALGAVCGCGSSEPAARPSLSKYRYVVRSVFVKESPEVALADVRLYFGSERVEASRAFEVPAAQLMVGSGSPLRLELKSSCGRELLPLEVTTASGGSEASERATADRAVYGHIIELRANYLGPWPHLGDVYVDRGPKPASAPIAVGTLAVDNPPRGGWSWATRLPLGPCEAGLDVSVGGKVVGRAAPRGKATLVDVTGGHCYRWQPHLYTRRGEAPSRTVKLSDAVVYRSSPGQYVHVIEEVAGVAGWAEAVVTTTGARYAEHATIERIDCPRTAATSRGR